MRSGFHRQYFASVGEVVGRIPSGGVSCVACPRRVGGADELATRSADIPQGCVLGSEAAGNPVKRCTSTLADTIIRGCTWATSVADCDGGSACPGSCTAKGGQLLISSKFTNEWNSVSQCLFWTHISILPITTSVVYILKQFRVWVNLLSYFAPPTALHHKRFYSRNSHFQTGDNLTGISSGAGVQPQYYTLNEFTNRLFWYCHSIPVEFKPQKIKSSFDSTYIRFNLSPEKD